MKWKGKNEEEAMAQLAQDHEAQVAAVKKNFSSTDKKKGPSESDEEDPFEATLAMLSRATYDE